LKPWRRTKLPGIRLVPVEFEIGWKAPSERTKPIYEFGATSLARDGEFPLVDGIDFDLIAIVECQRRPKTLRVRTGFGQAAGQRANKITVGIEANYLETRKPAVV
jgi:hypothetical protein